MSKIKWKGLQNIDAGSDCVYIATRGLRLKWWRMASMKAFLHHDARIHEQLKANPDCMGYAFRITPFPPEGWTLSAWPNIEAMRSFYQQHAHAEAMQALSDQAKGSFRLVKWDGNQKSMPEQWSEITTRFRNQ